MRNKKEHIEISVDIDGRNTSVTMSGCADLVSLLSSCCCIVDSFAEAFAHETKVTKKKARATLIRALVEVEDGIDEL